MKISNIMFGVICISILIAGPVQGEILNIWVDDTVSVHPEARIATINNLYKQLPMVIKKHGITEIRIYHLGHEPWLAIPECFPIPQLQVNCRESKITDELEIFKSLKVREAIACVEERKKEESKYDVQIREFLPGIQDILMKSPSRGSPCTAVHDFLARVSAEQGIVIVITDGVETCQKAIDSPTISANATKILILLTPSKGETGKEKSLSQMFESKKNALAKRYPCARIEPMFSGRISQVIDDM